jgi:hypothetical protein
MDVPSSIPMHQRAHNHMHLGHQYVGPLSQQPMRQRLTRGPISDRCFIHCFRQQRPGSVHLAVPNTPVEKLAGQHKARVGE